MDNSMEIQSSPVDVIDLMINRPKMEFRLWKHMYDRTDLDNHLATTQKELADELNAGAPKVSIAMKGLIRDDMVQRDGIHFYINPWHVWFGEDWRKQQARVEWDKRKELDEVNR